MSYAMRRRGEPSAGITDRNTSPGAYWSSTERDLVTYESRLELARLLFADFEPSVLSIVASPSCCKRKRMGNNGTTFLTIS